MKKGLSSLDVSVISGELNTLLHRAKLEKVYQVGSRELLFRLHLPGVGSKDLVVAPNYMCLTNYTRIIPQNPSSFAMQLRKNLGGARINEIRQHSFDRIIEIVFEGKKNFVIVIELFSKGNLLLCTDEMKIIGLLDWQKWRHRTLGVGKNYEYPPENINAKTFVEHDFIELLKGDERPVVSALASGIGLGGFIAEEICINADVDKNLLFNDLDEAARVRVWESFSKIITSSIDESFLVSVDGNPVDVIPFKTRQYPEDALLSYDSFSEACDEFFSVKAAEQVKDRTTKVVDEKKDKILNVLVQQEASIKNLGDRIVSEKARGDLIFSHMNEIENLINAVKQYRKNGLSDKDVLTELKKMPEGRLVKNISKLELILDL